MWRLIDAPLPSWFRWLMAGAGILLLAAMTATSHAPAQEASNPRQALVITIDGAIGPAIADYIAEQLAEIDPATTGLVILRMDTPGGLDTAMRKIIRAELASPAPVAVYVAPAGARAASAGTYILYAASVAAMAPGTNLGAATPITIGGVPEFPEGERDEKEPDKAKPDEDKESKPDADKESKSAEPAEPLDTSTPERRKLVNDAAAYIRGLAQMHGRNADWAEQAVRGAASLPAEEALRRDVIDVVAATLPELLRKIDGRTVLVNGEKETLATADLELIESEIDWRTRLLMVITDPTIAYLLMLVGIYGLIFEFANPGTYAPGVIGGISLLLALFAFSVLPVDYVGMALILLGIALMVAEAFAPSFGILGLGGLTAFAIGSVILFKAGMPGYGVPIAVVIAGSIVTGGLLILVLAMLVRSRHHAVITGKEGLIGSAGEVVEWNGRDGRVRVLGELWLAHASEALQPGDPVEVRSREGLLLTVARRGSPSQ
ncbi:MAG TPA: nodulation protein NfeD [Dongiaceae bacterium]|nr:nodulation protein NfeD [Dongiaceae bacterium]